MVNVMRITAVDPAPASSDPELMADLLVGADIGTSACKATLLRAEDGVVLAHGHRTLPAGQSQAGLVGAGP